jgi:hypothetical protein
MDVQEKGTLFLLGDILMSHLIRRCMLGLALLFTVAVAYAPTPADAQVVVKVGPHRRHHRRAYYRHGHRYYR